jgi:type I restriction enzyme S subunit
VKKPYQEYKASEIGWLGDIPSHWQKNKFKYLLREKTKTQNIELPCGSISFGKVVYKDSEKLTEETKLAYQEVLSGEFLINPLNLNYDLKSLRTALSQIDVIVSSGYIVLQSENIAVKTYLKWLLFVFDIRHMKTLGAGIRQTITFNDIGNCITFLPPEYEQILIGEFLNRETARIDKLIAEKQTFIKLLKEKRQALISHVVTKGLNPNVEMKNSGIEWIGDVPEHWDVKKIKYLSSNFMYGTSVDCNLTDDGYPVLRIPNIDGVTVNFNDLKYTSLDKNEASRYLVAEGDVLVIRTNGNPAIVGQSALFSSQEEFLFASYLIKLTPDRKINSNFFIQAMNSLSIRQALTFQSRTSVGNYNLNIPSLSNTYMAIPSIEEQIQIAKYLDVVKNKYDSIISETTQSLNYLAEHRTALISAAVTGKVDVRHFKEEAA